MFFSRIAADDFVIFIKTISVFLVVRLHKTVMKWQNNDFLTWNRLQFPLQRSSDLLSQSEWLTLIRRIRSLESGQAPKCSAFNPLALAELGGAFGGLQKKPRRGQGLALFGFRFFSVTTEHKEASLVGALRGKKRLEKIRPLAQALGSIFFSFSLFAQEPLACKSFSMSRLNVRWWTIEKQ